MYGAISSDFHSMDREKYLTIPCTDIAIIGDASTKFGIYSMTDVSCTKGVYPCPDLSCAVLYLLDYKVSKQPDIPVLALNESVYGRHTRDRRGAPRSVEHNAVCKRGGKTRSRSTLAERV